MIADSREDFPAFGKPNNPTSANIFNLSHTQISSPSSPGLDLLGACSLELLKCVLPKPPFPPCKKNTFSPSSVISCNIVSLSASEIICVPIGTFIIMSCPLAPLQFFPEPSVPFLALKCCL